MWIVVRCLLGDEIADLGDEIEAFGPNESNCAKLTSRQGNLIHSTSRRAVTSSNSSRSSYVSRMPSQCLPSELP